MTTSSERAAAGVAAPGTADGAVAAVAGALGTEGVALLAPACGSVVLAAGVGPPNSDGLPLWICQLFQRSNSEKEKIIQRTVRRISMVPTEVNTGQQSPPV
jgi:hypothetical protein